jgi:hypothetical protein
MFQEYAGNCCHHVSYPGDVEPEMKTKHTTLLKQFQILMDLKTSKIDTPNIHVYRYMTAHFFGLIQALDDGFN